jgi:hypothetical protein
MNALEELKAEIIEMRRGGSKEDQKPHKLILLLSVIDQADAGLITENKIYLSPQLISEFEKYFRQVSDREDWCQPGPPFFHLRSSSFWKHQPKLGREQVYGKLSTSGGGLKRIQDNIEYAYLSESAYQVFSDANARQELKDFIMTLLARDTPRLKTVFHETFSLSRSSLQQVLFVAAKTRDTYMESQEHRENILRDKTNLGTRYVKAMPRYAVGTGLLGANYRLTTFAKFVQKHDSLLDQVGTQWLMHYHLSAPQGPGPAFWHDLVITRFRGGDEFTASEIAEQISQFFQKTEGEPLAERSARSTATIFLGTYTKQDGLSNLNILQGIGEDRYRVNDDLDPPPVWAVAYAILNFWEALLQGRKTINLDELTDENSVANLFMIGAGKIAAILQKMQAEGFVDLFRVSPPYQVVLLRQDTKAILERLYAHE